MPENNQSIRMQTLLDVLVLYTKLYHKPFSAETLIAGLPIAKGQSAPDLFSITAAKGLFSRAANRAGLNTRLIKRPLKKISPLQLPMIVPLAKQQAAIIAEFSKDRQQVKLLFAADEVIEQWYDLDVLEEEYLGYAFMVKRQFEYREQSNGNLNIKQKHWFWSTLNYSRRLYRDVFFASILINIFVLATPLFTMNVYDRVIPNRAIETLHFFAFGVLIIYVLDGFLKYSRTYLLEMAAKKSDIIMSSVIFEKVMDLKMSIFPPSVGSFANNLKDFDTIRSFFANSTMAAFIDLPFAVIFLAVIYYIGGILVILPILIMGIIIIYAIIIRGPLQKSIEQTHVAAAMKNSLLIESLQNIETLKSLGHMAHVQWSWEEASGEIANRSLKTRVLSSSISSFTSILIQLNTVLIIVAGVYLISDFQMTMGGLIAVVILSSRSVAPMGQVATLLTNFADAKTSYQIINGILSQPSERSKQQKFVERPLLNGKIEFNNVTFSYPGVDFPALKNISFKINPGEKIAIIGRMGSGKSTIEKLILKLYEPDSGSILIDGIDINQIDPIDLRRNIGYVSQDIALFKGTVKDNIVFRASHATDEQIIRAAKISGAEEFISKHPMGYAMPIGERGMGLSGGQRQSIGISRAFLLDSHIMLLDEPTNAMDQLSENRLMVNLSKQMRQKTTILVTQKLNLLNLTQRVIVLQDGRIYIDGPKEVVLKKLNGNAHV
jgi:ATP-binding cassette, subfamily C, bacterial LapB